MSILTIQKRTRRLGEIRLGMKGDKGLPVKLETLRLTSVSKGLLEQAAKLWGGTVEPWDTKYSLVTETNELPVVVPPQDPASISWYELWSQGGLQRRCDGERMILGDAPVVCICSQEEESGEYEYRTRSGDSIRCQPTTRVQFMLPDIEDIGVWVLRSTGYYAAVELGAAMDLLLRQMEDTGWMPEATLSTEERVVKRPGKPPNRFVVPTLRLHSKLSDLLPSGPPTPALEAPTGSDDAGTSVEQGSLPPSPASPPADEIVDGEVVHDGADTIGEQWAELWALLEENPTEGNMGAISDRVRRLYALMHATEHWAERAFHAALKKKYDAEHLGDLRRASLEVFATSSFLAAREKVGAPDASSE